MKKNPRDAEDDMRWEEDNQPNFDVARDPNEKCGHHDKREIVAAEIGSRSYHLPERIGKCGCHAAGRLRAIDVR